MKATFNTNPTDSSPQITTNTLTFDNGQVIQSSTTNQLKGKAATPTARHISNTTTSQNNKKPPIPKVRISLKEKIQFIISNFQENYFINKLNDAFVPCLINLKKCFIALLLFRLEHSFFFSYSYVSSREQ